MKSGFIANATLLSLLLSGYALAGDDCSEPVNDWQPRETLRQQVERQYGWSVLRIKVDDGCYEAYGKDQAGKKQEVYFNPKTFEVVLSKSES